MSDSNQTASTTTAKCSAEHNDAGYGRTALELHVLVLMTRDVARQVALLTMPYHARVFTVDEVAKLRKFYDVISGAADAAMELEKAWRARQV